VSTLPMMFADAQWSLKGVFTGEPDAPVRHTWIEAHQRGRQRRGRPRSVWGEYGRCGSRCAPVDIAPTAHGI
jgi:fatty-acyl-CoA synthase